jgi:hypothetical protein
VAVDVAGASPAAPAAASAATTALPIGASSDGIPADNVLVGVFQAAFAEILRLMERDSFPRYLRSPVFEQLLKTVH